MPLKKKHPLCFCLCLLTPDIGSIFASISAISHKPQFSSHWFLSSPPHTPQPHLHIFWAGLNSYKAFWISFFFQTSEYSRLWLANDHIVTCVARYHRCSKQPAYDTRFAIDENPWTNANDLVILRYSSSFLSLLSGMGPISWPYPRSFSNAYLLVINRVVVGSRYM